MIRRVSLRRFKRFGQVDFNLPGHVVLAGPNNTGKTTLLQAVAAWSLAFERWKALNDFRRRDPGGAYVRAPFGRRDFSAVPLRAYELLWTDRAADRGPIEIEVSSEAGWTIAMEFIQDTTEQIFVRPKGDCPPESLRSAVLASTFVPPMTGLGTEEPVYQAPKINQLLGMAKPGDVLRNLLVAASNSSEAWGALNASMKRLFGYELRPPDSSGANIIAEYKPIGAEVFFDIASAGSGFQQVLMLLTFLNTRPGAVLLLDEPDAHLHIILQDAIFGELREVAARQKSQLIIATHSEVIINSVAPENLCVMSGTPRLLADTAQRRALISGLRALDNTDIMRAADAAGILYLEDYTDVDILRAWAKVLGHKLQDCLGREIIWKKTVIQPREGAKGISHQEHFDALCLLRPDFPGLALVDGDVAPGMGDTAITGKGLQRLRWRRYEIESYLVHPAALERFIVGAIGPQGAGPAVQDLGKHFAGNYPPDFIANPLGDIAFLRGTKARTELLPPALTAAGLPGLDYTRYHEIAALMKPEEIHPEVKEKLDQILRAFNLA